MTIGVLVSALTAIGIGLTVVSVKRIKDFDSMLVMFHYGWSSSILLGIPLAYECIFKDGRLPLAGISTEVWIKLFFASFSNQIAMTLSTICN